jgi:asparagine synthase (glutamine-hydrolysing)
VAKLKRSPLHRVEMNSDNWLGDRIDKIWQTDGTCSLVHMQFTAALEHIQKQNLFDVILHGSAGDGVVGGQHLFEPSQLDYYVTKRLNLISFSRSQQHFESVLNRFRHYFDSIGQCSHALYIDNRIRSFLFKDSRVCFSYGIECRLPFMDNAFQELLYSIPMDLKLNNRLYSLMLLRQFPEFYQHIPRQGTGEPISQPGLNRKFKAFYNRAQKKVIRELQDLKFLPLSLEIPSKPKDDFHNYAQWFRQEPTYSWVKKTLHNPNACYPEFVGRQPILEDWEDCLQGRSSFERVGQILTLEVWLQQILKQQQSIAPQSIAPQSIAQ